MAFFPLKLVRPSGYAAKKDTRSEINDVHVATMNEFKNERINVLSDMTSTQLLNVTTFGNSLGKNISAGSFKEEIIAQ